MRLDESWANQGPCRPQDWPQISLSNFHPPPHSLPMGRMRGPPASKGGTLSLSLWKRAFFFFLSPTYLNQSWGLLRRSLLWGPSISALMVRHSKRAGGRAWGQIMCPLPGMVTMYGEDGGHWPWEPAGCGNQPKINRPLTLRAIPLWYVRNLQDDKYTIVYDVVCIVRIGTIP